MTGFVDPAFKHIKVTEPNFIVWRISKWEWEWYEAKVIMKENYGNFYNEDSYIVYSSTPVKRLLGKPGTGRASKMEIHIHFWLGSQISEGEYVRTILKVRELDEVLEGAGTLHREMQGYESSRFLSYFKKGMFIHEGDITTVLKRNLINTKLYELSQRASTLILTEQPSVSWVHMNSNSIFVLRKSCRLFAWIGRKVSLGNRHLVLELEKMIQADKPNGRVIWVFDGKENELTVDELEDFEKDLKLEDKLLADTDQKDFLFLQSEFRSVTTLYNVARGDKITHVKDGPLRQSDLHSMEICIVDHCMNAIWIWVRRKVPNEEKSRAINIAISYLEKEEKLKSPEQRKLSVKRVVEGSEPQEFKLLFNEWTDTYSFEPDIYFLKKLSKVVNKKFAAQMLEDYPFLAAETQLFDGGNGEVRVARVDTGGLVHIDAENVGIFHSSYTYLVCYTYRVNGIEKKILYSWLGNKSLYKKNEDIWRFMKQMCDVKDEYVRVRIEQFMETSHFYAIFKGKIMILDGQPIATGHEIVLDGYPFLLFKVIETGANALSVEVSPSHDCLCPENVFLLRTPTLSYVWCGANSKGDEREVAKSVAHKWTRQYEVILQGYEGKDFRSFMNKFGLGVGASRREIVPVKINVPATLYKCSLSGKKLRVSEIINFDKSDLSSSDIIILDVRDVIFVWIGEDAIEEPASSKDTQIILKYLQSDPSCRSGNLPIIYVSQNHEPPTFRGFFPTWTNWTQVTLQEIQVGETLSDPHPRGKDEELSNYQFWRAFGMKREVFKQYPLWKQMRLKKLAGF